MKIPLTPPRGFGKVVTVAEAAETNSTIRSVTDIGTLNKRFDKVFITQIATLISVVGAIIANGIWF